ncbi:MAG: VCBS repeat-containing protein [Proteobacteria bacterium]|nr:VCBS repeat-containing protein [Pseudomonadota bacterium]
MKLNRPWWLILSASVILLVCMGGLSAGADTAKKVLVLPFKMNAAQDMTFLQQGIIDMLSSRLAWDDKVVVLPKSQSREAFDKVGGRVDQTAARSVGGESGADYVLFGSVTVLGKNVSLDASMLDLRSGAAPMTIFTQTEGMDAVIPKVNEFADEINSKLFGRAVQRGAAAAEAQSKAQPEPKGPIPAYRRHPDYLLTGKEGQVRPSPLNPYLISSGDTDAEGVFWRSPSMANALIGLDLGDLDGDKQNEIIYADRQAVFVGRLVEGQFRQIAKFEGLTSDRFITLDVADIDGNGQAEIFVSNQRQTLARSLVLELNGGKLVPRIKDVDWYFRVQTVGNRTRLLGQQGGMTNRFYGGVYEMRYEKGGYVPGQQLGLPAGVNLYNFAAASLGKTPDKEYLAVIDDKSQLTIMSRGGQELWTGTEPFAATMNYLEEPVDQINPTVTDTNSPRNPRFYVPARILIVDLNEDGRNEIVLAKNELAGVTSILERLRSFVKGSVYSLSFDDLSIRENWHSRKLAEFVADYQIKDYNNDGKKDLVLAVNMKYGEGILNSRSTIIAYELAPPEDIRKKEQETKTER